MKVNIILFGQLTDITGTDTFTVEGVDDTTGLTNKLQDDYPALSNSKYIIAIDKKVIAENTVLTENCTVALLPPFSGG
ncbi:MAG: MoaD/ThiS family protein [Ferruginibacter sp.]